MVSVGMHCRILGKRGPIGEGFQVVPASFRRA
jgi:hypothetical protein